MNAESTPKGASESATTTPPSVPDEVDLTREMLARLEDLLDRIITTLAPLVAR